MARDTKPGEFMFQLCMYVWNFKRMLRTTKLSKIICTHRSVVFHKPLTLAQRANGVKGLAYCDRCKTELGMR
jgi:hypothetical protein